MDEPLSNLDAKLRLEMRAEIRRIHDALGSHHDLCHSRSGRGAVARRPHRRDARRRRSVRSARREDLYARPAHLDVAEFMGFRNRVPGRRRARGRPGARRGRRTRIHRASREQPLHGRAVVVAIRPDDLAPARDGGTAGDRRQRRVPRPGVHRLAAGPRRHGTVVPRATAARAGETVRLALRPAERAGVLPRASDDRRRAAASVASARLARAARRPDVAGAAGAGLHAGAVRLSLRLRSLVVFDPKDGGVLANYLTFFSDPFLYRHDLARRCWLSLPVTVINLLSPCRSRSASG